MGIEWIREALAELERQGLARRLREVGGKMAAEITVDGRPVVQFASNDYLALAGDVRLAEAAARAAREAGVGAGASRLVVGSHAEVTALERRLAEWKAAEAALVLPTGYMANLAVLGSLVGPGDAVFADRLCHASMLDGVKLAGARLVTWRHGDVGHLRERLAEKTNYGRRLVMTESVFSMDGDVADLGAVCRAAAEAGAMVLVDEAHATGVFGRCGTGVAEAQGIAKGAITATVGTLSKALGGLGGFVTGSREVIELIVNRGRAMIFTTAVTPVQAAVARAAIDVVETEPERRARVLELARRLRDGVRALGLDTLASASQIVPVVLGEAERATAVSAALWEHGYYVPAVRPPTVKAGTCRLRASVTSGHTEEQVDGLLAALGAAV